MRGPKRELISRAYNRLLHTVLRARFSDAQCGFKAVRGDVAAGLLESVRDDGWFFDTELLVLAQRRGLRIHEVPVDWVDDPDSRVDIVSTALTDLRGVARLLVDGPIARFMAIGVVEHAGLRAAVRAAAPRRRRRTGRTAIALALTAVGNTAANRRLTFRVRGREGLVRHHLRGAAVFVLTLMLTTRRARRPARAGQRPRPLARARRAGRRHPDGDHHALRRPAHLGLPRAGQSSGWDTA